MRGEETQMSSESPTVVTFIVRMTRNEAGIASGIIERASTGAKQPVDRCEDLGRVVAEMLAAEPKKQVRS